ncbi:unnamed protein product [Heterobilharzia americana]|nr:unnamed protein product [Heterobilharzia americana]
MGRGPDTSSEVATAIQTYYQTTQDYLTRVETKADRLLVVEEKVDKLLKLFKEFKSTPTVQDGLSKTGASMDKSPGSRLERILAEQGKQGTEYSRSKSAEETVSKVIQTTKSSQLVVFEKQWHRFAAFVPPTADRTPRLFPDPIPWDKKIQKPLYLGWKPPVYIIEGWSEPNDYEKLSEERKLELQSSSISLPTDLGNGLPKNPGGRTGVNGKGHLPLWGPNSAIILLVTRSSSDQTSGPSDVTTSSFKFIAYKHLLGSQLPWLLVQHPSGCKPETCTKEIIESIIHSRMRQLIKLNPKNQSVLQEAVQRLSRFPPTIIHTGYLDDAINTDHAWIEPTAVHIHIRNSHSYNDTFLQLFSVEGVTFTWLDSTDKAGMRTSHQKILQQTEKIMRSWKRESSKPRKEVKFEKSTYE